jgi:hypothetical protein
MARVAEWEVVTTARTPRGWMIAGLRGAVESNVADELEEADAEKSFYDVLGEVTAYYVCREPLDVPYDADEGFALMWTIPGMGGEVRALVRDKTLQTVLQRDGEGLRSPAGPIEGATLLDFQRTWKYGFLLRSFEEFFWEDYSEEGALYPAELSGLCYQLWLGAQVPTRADQPLGPAATP